MHVTLDQFCNQAILSIFRAIKLGDKEIEYNDSFRLILHTKLANPHYKPEMQAQTTLINFTVTRDGLYTVLHSLRYIWNKMPWNVRLHLIYRFGRPIAG